MEQETGTGNTVGSLPKDSGIVQTFLAILQNILGFNLYACGVPGAYLLTLLFGAMGFTGVISMLISLLGGILAIFAVTAARKLVYHLEHGDKKWATKPLAGDSRFNPDKLMNSGSSSSRFNPSKTMNNSDATKW